MPRPARLGLPLSAAGALWENPAPAVPGGDTGTSIPRSFTPPTGWERLFWLVFNRSTIPMALLDESRVRLAVNQALCDYHQRSREELIGHEVDEVVGPAGLERFRNDWKDLLRLGDWVRNVDLVRSDGTLLHSEFAARLTVINGRRVVLSVLVAGEPVVASVAQVSGELSPRERTVVHLLTLGLTSREIAERMSISVQTVRTHVRNAMAKTGTRTRAQLVAVALGDALTHEVGMEAEEESPA